MSGPTPNAYPTIYPWAVAEVNYPAGGNPWNGQPVNVAPAGDIFTPNTKPPAQTMNYVLNKMTGSVAAPGNDVAILQATALVQASNFAQGSINAALNNISTFTCVAYDSVNDLFILGAINNSSHASGFILAGRGDAFDPFTQPGTIAGPLGMIGSSMSNITCVFKDPTDAVTYYIGGIQVGGGLGAWRVTVPAPSGTAITVTQIINISTPPTWTDLQFAYLNGHLIAAAASAGTPASSFIWSSTNQGTSWGSVNNFTVLGWTLATNGSEFIAAGGVSGGAPLEVTSTDGATFTASGSSFSGLPTASSNVLGLTWGSDPLGSAWFLAYQNGSNSKFQWLRSPDGATWTLQPASLSGANWTASLGVHTLTSMGGLLVQFAWDSNGNIRVLYSTDGATTWQIAPFRAARSGGQVVGMAAAPNRLVGYLAATPIVSQAQGFSALQAV